MKEENYSKVKKLLYYVLIVIAVFIGIKLSVFLMPFLIALIIANSIEPLIKWFSNKTKLLRKTSAIIILIIFFSMLIALIVGASYLIVNEVIRVLKDFGDIGPRLIKKIEYFIKLLKLEDVNIPDEIRSLIIKNTNELISYGLNYLKHFLLGMLNLLTKIPIFIIYLVVTILATYFITTNRIAILDELEQNIPKKWIRKANNHIKNITSALGKYVKSQLILISISFIIVLIGLYIFKIVGLNIKTPFLIALVIGFVDLLPILGSGTVMCPWGIIEIINGNIVLGISILGLLALITLVRRFLEPKIVSKNIGVNPLYTLMAMYIGFRLLGIGGLIIGPIVLVIIISVCQTGRTFLTLLLSNGTELFDTLYKN